MRCAYAAFDAMLSDDSTQVGGVINVMDCSSMGKKQLSQWENPRVMFKAIRNWQDAYPIRTKAVIYWKEPLIMDVVFNMLKAAPFMKKKLKDRVSALPARELSLPANSLPSSSFTNAAAT